MRSVTLPAAHTPGGWKGGNELLLGRKHSAECLSLVSVTPASSMLLNVHWKGSESLARGIYGINVRLAEQEEKKRDVQLSFIIIINLVS